MVFEGLLEVACQIASRWRGLGHEVTFHSFSELFQGGRRYLYGQVFTSSTHHYGAKQIKVDSARVLYR